MKLSPLDYHIIAGSYNDINSSYSVAPSDYTRMLNLKQMIEHNKKYWSSDTSINNNLLFNDVQMISKEFASTDRIQQFTRGLLSVYNFSNPEESAAIMKMVGRTRSAVLILF